MQIIEGDLSLLGDEKIAIISSRFNHLITDRLIEGAKDCFLRHGGIDENLTHILVPGAFEIPFALEKVLAQGNYDGVCCLGAIIRGSTPHFDYVSAEATKGIANVTIRYGAAVTFGVLTTDTIEQAIERAGTKAGNKGFEAMSSLIELINLYRKIGA
ncbi:6,7-dimethyl-8-ribityllumazine synthase [Helicobacter canadensis]|uniref:6,7-dimethyl-8-ribityllumazine synthase n=1 Tax=Helicobacter canadensis MIT 98-5491 TaxID=537970 RepID=C5ZYQ4_9HELI|nr:6,7-dimethyl-8-ribityllumazine synthase [Helicobacter canadensis]EES89162.1 riboflavin synthase subunit beta [Helicobacter canadensis MIT 98-5491]EFR47943.1 6,7-dimethyl-8-ribityllumazine synthase [Helicobacter canadensis MIT 98-5491]STO99195.1 riboflavin synthase subunit beta [Helicobacter canadensis]